MNATTLILVRHGESEWNRENRFTGWFDVDLSEQGRLEAKNAGQLLYRHKFILNYGYTSVLKRAIHTLWIILDQLNQSWIPVQKAWQLNERHYGELQGLNKTESIKKYGYDTVQKWRRGFSITPPKAHQNNQFLGTNDIRYKNINNLPNGESLASTLNRVQPYWNNFVVPNLKKYSCIIVVAHGNSIRSIIKFLDNLNESEIFNIEIPTGIPLIYEFNENNIPSKHYYLT